jgi:hypothetical protein
MQIATASARTRSPRRGWSRRWARSSRRTSPWLVGDDDFKKLVAIIRMAVPYTGMILSTRERPEFRRELMEIGFSQVSAGSKTSPGGYTEHNPDEDDTRQFELGDHRGLDEVMLNLCQQGYLPSFCTACYRSGRTGEHFMELAKPGEIQTFCLPNALISFKEYLLDYAGPETHRRGRADHRRAPRADQSDAIRQRTEEKLRRTEQGERDLYDHRDSQPRGGRTSHASLRVRRGRPMALPMGRPRRHALRACRSCGPSVADRTGAPTPKHPRVFDFTSGSSAGGMWASPAC